MRLVQEATNISLEVTLMRMSQNMEAQVMSMQQAPDQDMASAD